MFIKSCIISNDRKRILIHFSNISANAEINLYLLNNYPNKKNILIINNNVENYIIIKNKNEFSFLNSINIVEIIDGNEKIFFEVCDLTSIFLHLLENFKKNKYCSDCDLTLYIEGLRTALKLKEYEKAKSIYSYINSNFKIDQTKSSKIFSGFYTINNFLCG